MDSNVTGCADNGAAAVSPTNRAIARTGAQWVMAMLNSVSLARQCADRGIVAVEQRPDRARLLRRGAEESAFDGPRRAGAHRIHSPWDACDRSRAAESIAKDG